MKRGHAMPPTKPCAASDEAAEGETLGTAKVDSQSRRPKWHEEMNQLYFSVRTRQVSERLVQRVFTPIDKKNAQDFDENNVGALTGLEMWLQARGGTLGQAVVEIAYAVEMIGPQNRQWLLQQLGIEGEDAEATVSIAIQSKELVVVDSAAPAAHWRQEEIAVPWRKRRKLWDYFVSLCRAAKQGKPLDHTDFEQANPQHLKDWKHKLIHEPGFPQTLSDQMDVEGGSHKLHVSGAKIEIFTLSICEELVRWQAPKPARR